MSFLSYLAKEVDALAGGQGAGAGEEAAQLETREEAQFAQKAPAFSRLWHIAPLYLVHHLHVVVQLLQLRSHLFILGDILQLTQDIWN